MLVKANVAMVANPSLALTMELRSRRLQPARQFNESPPLAISLVKACACDSGQESAHLFALAFIPCLERRQASGGGECLFLLLAHRFGCLHRQRSADIEADRRHPQTACGPLHRATCRPLPGSAWWRSFCLWQSWAVRCFLRASSAGWRSTCAGDAGVLRYLKRFAVVDVLVLSGLYILRLLAGGAATQTHISHWMAGFSIFLFLSLAFVRALCGA